MTELIVSTPVRDCCFLRLCDNLVLSCVQSGARPVNKRKQLAPAAISYVET